MINFIVDIVKNGQNYNEFKIGSFGEGEIIGDYNFITG